MYLIVGLGNPGPRYETTRHNAGFLLVDELAERAGASWQKSKFDALEARGRILGESVLFLKPQTMMNLSGRSVSPCARFYKIQIPEIIAIYDDIDQPSLQVKMRAGGGHGGHNGIRSMAKELGSNDFYRVKVGVGRPQQREDGDVSSWVLNQLSDEELLAYQNEILDAVELRLKNIFDQNG